MGVARYIERGPFTKMPFVLFVFLFVPFVILFHPQNKVLRLKPLLCYVRRYEIQEPSSQRSRQH